MARFNWGNETRGIGGVPDRSRWSGGSSSSVRKPKVRVISRAGQEASRVLWALADEFERLPVADRRRRYELFGSRLSALQRDAAKPLSEIENRRERSRALLELDRQRNAVGRLLAELADPRV